MDSIENHEIRGLSMRSLFWLLSCTATIIFSVLTVYFKLAQQIQTIEIQKLGDLKYQELQQKDLSNRIDVNSIDIREIKTRLTIIEQKLK